MSPKNHQPQKGKRIRFPEKHTNSEICEVMAKILSVPEEKIEENIDLFQKINRYVFVCLYYLSKIEDEQDLTSAVHSMEFVCNFKKGVHDYMG
ncbi:MAG: hypothetical protein K0R25_239 [Rickettsiaceae bacterium]|jgi:hypothetical protein|nr:hypothetical protein [Rickettsiaceae bacterium]